MVWRWFQDLRTLRGCFDADPLGIRASTKTPSRTNTVVIRNSQWPVAPWPNEVQETQERAYSSRTEVHASCTVVLFRSGLKESVRGRTREAHSSGNGDQARKAATECLSWSPSTTRPGRELLFRQHLAATIHPREDRLRCFPRRQCDPQARIAGCRRRKEGSCESWDRFSAKALQHPRQVGNSLGRCGSSRQLRMRGWGSQRHCTSVPWRTGAGFNLTAELTLDIAR